MPYQTPGINPTATRQQDPAVGDPQSEQALMDQMLATLPPDQFQKLQEEFATMPPEMRAQRLKALATDFGLIGQDASTDMTRADALRQSTPQMRQAGGMSIAANPLEHVAQVMQNRKQADAYTTGRTARTGAREGARDVRQSTMADLLRQ